MRLAFATKANRTARRRRIDDTATLRDLEFSGRNEASGGAACRLLQFLPVLAADDPRSLRRTNRGASTTLCQELDEGGLERFVRGGDATLSTGTRAVANLVPIARPRFAPRKCTAARHTDAVGWCHATGTSSARSSAARASTLMTGPWAETRCSIGVATSCGSSRGSPSFSHVCAP